MVMDTESESVGTIICPVCATSVRADMVLWVLKGKWYCSEKCVRKAL